MNFFSPTYLKKNLTLERGNIFVHSEKIPIQVLSPLQSCRGTPMKLINFSPRLNKSTARIIRKYLGKMKESSFVYEENKERKANSRRIDNRTPQYEAFKVHRYARPRLLKAMRKEMDEEERTKEIFFKEIKSRSGFMGMKKKMNRSMLEGLNKKTPSPTFVFGKLPNFNKMIGFKEMN